MESIDYFNHKSPTKCTVSITAIFDQDEEAYNLEVWEQFNSRFREVQFVLDRNSFLIQQVNDNHRSRVTDNMVKNVALIREINNISKVISLYSDLSSNFSTFFHHHNTGGNAKDGGVKPDK